MPKQIDSSSALCKGMDTNLFYMHEDELLSVCINLIELRKICFSCPLMKECLEYGFKHEKYGTFGGITETERDLIRKRSWNNTKMEKLLKDLSILGISINVILPYADLETEFC